MWIFAGTFWLASAVILNSVGSMFSEPRTLGDLFPGYNGVMPPVEQLLFEDQFTNFSFYRNHRMDEVGRVLLYRRSRFIFGWSLGADRIEDAWILFPGLEDVCIVYDMNEQRWIDLPNDLCHKLGGNRLLDLINARDEVAATHVTTSNNPVYKEAHIRAYKQANERVDIVEREQDNLIDDDETTIENSITKIKEEYSRAYNRVFMLYLHQHGEYNISGYRERHV